MHMHVPAERRSRRRLQRRGGGGTPSRPTMHQDAILAEFDRLEGHLGARGEALRRDLATWLEAEPGLRVHSVTLRVKSRASLAGKLARPDRSYETLCDVTDLVGLRVVTSFEDEIDRVGRIVEARLPIDFDRSTDKRRRAGAGVFGYRSLHYVVRLDGDELPSGACGEIQVRTLLANAWAEIEHDLGYKTREEIPSSARRRLLRLAGMLELADEEFVAIRRDLEEYAAALPRRMATEDGDVLLDGLSLEALLASDEVREVDEAIAAAVGKPLAAEPFFPEYLLRMLASSGVRTVADARAGIREHRAAIPRMVEPYFAFAWRAWRLSPEPMSAVLRGYSLFFLAHAQVLRASSLGIDKVERLAHLYRQLDYPDDAGAAQRVARQLVEAFAEVI
jgi:putative GTP pyrophosphokinase